MQPIHAVNDSQINKNNHKLQAFGFTLIEVLVALVIVGILLGLMVPGYLNFLQKSRRADALAALSQYQLIMERCYSQNFAYNTACGGLPSFPINSPQGFYSISLTNLGATTYTLTATAIGAQARDTTCSSMSVNQANVKTAANSGGTTQTICWNPT